MTPDPYKASAALTDPGSWNRYAYVQGDPVNFTDPEGLQRGDGAPQFGPLPYFPPGPFGGYRNPNLKWCYNGQDDWGWYDECPEITPVATPFSKEEQDQKLAKAIEQALEALKDPNCSKFFGAEGSTIAPDPSTLLKDIQNGGQWGTMVYQEMDQGTWATTTPNFGGFGVTIALNSTPSGGWRTDSDAGRANTILHELAHAYQMIFGITADGFEDDSLGASGSRLESINRSNRNTERVRNACKI